MWYCARFHWFWKIREQFRAKSDTWYCWSSKVMSFRIKNCFTREGESRKNKKGSTDIYTLLLLLSCVSRVQLCATPQTAAHEAPVPGILQARTLEWVAISFSNAWKWKVKVKLLSHVRLLETPRTAAYQAPPPMGFSRQEYWSGVPLPSPINKLIYM